MNEFFNFLERLFTEGTVRLRHRPVLADADRQPIERLLEDAYTEHALAVAGAEPAFDATCAARGAVLLADACWFLLSHDEPPEAVVASLSREPPATTAGQLLSMDLCLRYLPEIYRRARRIDACDPLTKALADLLRRWPLAGVLAGLTEGPLGDLNFAGHPGLQLLYAERLALVPDVAWVPTDGPTRQWAELVFDRKGMTLPRPIVVSRESV